MTKQSNVADGVPEGRGTDKSIRRSCGVKVLKSRRVDITAGWSDKTSKALRDKGAETSVGRTSVAGKIPKKRGTVGRLRLTG